MSEPLLHWDARALRALLDPVLPGLSVEVVARTVSTNTDLLERARVAEAPCLRVAEQQTGGRGRQGRVWHSAAGVSLTFSLALPLQVTDWSGLSLAVGVAVAEALDPPAASTAGQRTGRPGPPRIGLKWPNDLWLMDAPGEGRKLGGILIETVAAGTQRLAVIGIGLNVHAMGISDVSSGFASLLELDTTATAPRVLQRIALPLVLALQRFEREGFGAFASAFAARDLLRGRAVRTTQPGVPEGVAQGVSAQGALLVQTGAGLEAVTSGEVSVRLNPGAAGHAQPQAPAQLATPSC